MHEALSTVASAAAPSNTTNPTHDIVDDSPGNVPMMDHDDILTTDETLMFLLVVNGNMNEFANHKKMELYQLAQAKVFKL